MNIQLKRYVLTLHVNDNIGCNMGAKTVLSFHTSLAEAKRVASWTHDRRLVHDLQTGTIVHDTRKSPGQVYNSPTMKGQPSGNLFDSVGAAVTR